MQLRNPGDYFLSVRRGLDWDDLLAEVRSDCAALCDLESRRSLARSAARRRALLDWVWSHRTDFGSAPGWGQLENDLFVWIVDGGRPEDAWEVAKLYAEVRQGAVLRLRTPAFGRPSGRAYLLDVANDKKQVEGDRLRALSLLGDRLTLWSEQRGVEPLGQTEQAGLIDGLTPLLQDPAPRVRAAAAKVLQSASCPGDGARSDRDTHRALPALTAAYKAEPPGPTRDDLAEAVAILGGPAHWLEVSGNTQGLRGHLRDFNRRDAQAYFWLELASSGLSVFECPRLRLERLEANGKVAEIREQPLGVVHLPRPWKEGWDGQPLLLVEFATTNQSPGTWRATVAGTAGRAKLKWVSEPKTFVVQPPDTTPGTSPQPHSLDW
jgi:hypothetical protein